MATFGGMKELKKGSFGFSLPWPFV